MNKPQGLVIRTDGIAGVNDQQVLRGLARTLHDPVRYLDSGSLQCPVVGSRSGSNLWVPQTSDHEPSPVCSSRKPTRQHKVARQKLTRA